MSSKRTFESRVLIGAVSCGLSNRMAVTNVCHTSTLVKEFHGPIHEWSRIEPGNFHDFQHVWIEELKRAFNGGVLPPEYYALAEQFAGGFGPDALTLQDTLQTDQAVRCSLKPSSGASIMDSPMSTMASCLASMASQICCLSVSLAHVDFPKIGQASIEGPDRWSDARWDSGGLTAAD